MNHSGVKTFLYPGILFLALTSFHTPGRAPRSTIRLVFSAVVGDSPLVLKQAVYVNPFGERYTVSRFRYYVSHLAFAASGNDAEPAGRCHLVDVADPSSGVITLSVPAGHYSTLYFLLGVDSLHNVSGAQSGDLDPDRGMFWTWNSGYVMAKLEGTSAVSPLVDHRFEYHIGGYAGRYAVLQEISLPLGAGGTGFVANRTYRVTISADVDAWWHGAFDLKIARQPAVATPGALAREISDNYARMFRIDTIIPEQE